MRREHHRRYQGLFTRLAILVRSLTSPAAAGVLLVLAAPLVITPAQGNAQSATYRVTFEGKFTASALASGVSVPSGEHFTTLIGAVHNGSVTFWSSGGTASAGVEAVAELGTTGTFESEIKANMNAVTVFEQSIASGGTATATVDIVVTTDHPRVTLLSMVAPSPDWFVGVSGLSLLDAQADWLPSHTVNLYPWDAGTEEGTEFSLSNAATSPQGTITSLRGTGKFSNEPIATLTFTLQEAAPEITSATAFPVDEGTTAVATLTAEDQDSAAADLAWSKAGGADAGLFTLSAAGDLAFTAAPDYENPDDADGDNVYEITVQVSDGDNTDTADIRVTLENVLELLTELTGPSSTDYAENGAVRVAAYIASSEADRDGIVWQLGGDDAEYFSIDNPLGVLRFHIDPVAPSLFLQPPDFEAPVDDDDDNVYEVIVFAQAGSALTLKSVIVTVTDENEAGAISLTTARPGMGAELRAELSDPDEVSVTPTWQWERSAGRNTWVVIDGAEAVSYTPTAADAGSFLRVTAAYTDRHGDGQSAQAVSAEVVTAELLSSLTVTTNTSTADPDKWAMRPEFSTDILHYAIGCADDDDPDTPTDDTMTLTPSAGAAVRLAVNGVQVASGSAIEVPVDGDSEVPITLATGSNGTSTTYVVHCMDSRNPAIERTGQEPGASTELITVYAQIGPSRRNIRATYLAIIDANGVPRWQRRLNTRASHFKAHPDGKYPYSYGRYVSQPSGYEMVILDENLGEVERVTTTRALQHTGAHDFAIRENGNYVFEAYEPATRNFSAYTDENGNPYGTSEATEDSVIEEVNPAGSRVFSWNSWKDMYLNDCLQHRFPNDYAHINSVQVVDEADIIASFRGCSQVWRIDRETEAGEWLLGRSNRSDSEWEARGIRALKIVGDPHGEFCGQHSARLIPNGHLLLFDNGWHCLEDPATGDTQRTDWGFSRVVEYALDPDNGEAVFVRQHCLGNECLQFSEAQGHIHRMDSGHWLVSWGRGAIDNWDRTGPYPEASLTEVDPLTNQELLSFKITHPDFYAGGDVPQPTRAYPVEFVALADTPGPLRAEIAESPASSLFHLGPTDAPKVVVAFNQPVVDLTAVTPSVNVQGATVESVNPHIVPGDPANTYLFTLTPTGVGPITFALVAGQSCASGGICTAGGTLLSEVPVSHVIPPRPTGPVVASITSSATHPTKDGFTVTITFSEPVMELTAGEIEVTKGTGSNFGGSGESYTLEIAPDAGIEDEVTVTVTAGAVVDGLNNGNLQASAAFSVDTKAPTVSTIAITSNPGTDRTYAPGDVIEVTVTFDEAVVVAGPLRLTLNVGGGNRTANYQSGVDATLLFSYTVADGESDADGVSIEADSLSRNGGTIQDEADNDAVLDHEALAADSSHKVDGVKPELTVTDGAVVDGATLTLTYDETLDGSSRPETGDFTVSGGDQARTVSRVVVRGAAVVLTLDSEAEHEEAGIQVSYTPGTNPIRDVLGNQAVALSRVPVKNDTPDTTAPAVSRLAIGSNPGADQTYAAGDEIQVTVSFSETVEVEGTPRLTLRVGSRNRPAGYLRGSGAAALVFGYEVVLGDEDTDGVSIAAGRIDRNGGTIKDEADNDAVLDHEAVAPQVGHKVDGVRPAFLSAAVDGSSLTLTYGEALDEGSRPAPGDFTVEVGGTGRSVSAVSVRGSVVTLTLDPAVEHGDTGIRVNYSPGTRPIRDAVGNDALGLSRQSVTNTTGAPNSAPEITSPGSFDVPENQALVRRLAARDDDPGDEVTGWEIVGGADRFQFSVAPDTGELSFRTAPDFEAPGDNEYEVTVEVRSGAGARELEAEQTFTVRVTNEREPPAVPEAPTFSGETADSLRVSWREPDNTGPPITDYDVQYREGGSGGFTDVQHEGPGLALTLSDLKAGTLYQVQVQATNEEGTGDWSEPGEGRTIAPLTVQMTPSPPPPVEGAFSLRFSFSEEVRGFTSGDIETQQEPACTDSANNPISCNPTMAALQTTDNRIFTTTVTPRTERVAHNYTLTITVPADRVTSSPDNKPNEATTLDVRIAPPGVTVPISSLGRTASPGNGRVTLRWNAPQNTGGSAIIRYEYRWRESGGVFGAWVSVGPAERAVTVSNLTNGREYVFEVRGANALGYGPVETATATPESRDGGGFPPPPRPPANNRPMADAGPDQTGVREGALVTLDGSGSSDPDDDPLKYRWNQYRGERVALSSRDVVNPTFTAPRELTADVVLSFRLLVTDPGGRFDSDTVTVTVDPEAEPPPTEDRIYYFPHLAVGDNWQTTITYINYSREEVTCQTDFISDHGSPLMVSFAELGMVDSRTDVLPPGGSVHQETDVALSAPLAPGWARANCTGPVQASLLFRWYNSEGMPVAEAGVNAATVPATRFVTFAEQGEGKNGTGVAYANPSDTAALVTFTARDADGEVPAIEDLMLPPNWHGAQNMPTLFDLSSFTGSLEVTSTEPIVSLSLNFEAAPVFSSLPPGELDASAQGSTTYYFPHLAVGDNWQTTITYINYSREEVTCQTDFISDHGSPLMVSFAELGMVDSRTDVLPPGGSVHQETDVDLSAPLAPGWARANCSGPVQASLLFRWYNSEGMPVAEAGVNAATVPATRFVTFAEQGEGKNGTGVAYANPSDTAALVTFTARDADGEVPAIEDLMLPPNWHGAQNMPTLFDLSSFTGSLEVTSTEPIVSLSLNFEAAPVFSSLPPGELEAAAQ